MEATSGELGGPAGHEGCGQPGDDGESERGPASGSSLPSPAAPTTPTTAVSRTQISSRHRVWVISWCVDGGSVAASVAKPLRTPAWRSVSRARVSTPSPASATSRRGCRRCSRLGQRPGQDTGEQHEQRDDGPNVGGTTAAPAAAPVRAARRPPAPSEREQCAVGGCAASAAGCPGPMTTVRTTAMTMARIAIGTVSRAASMRSGQRRSGAAAARGF